MKQGTKIMCMVIASSFFSYKFLATFSPLFQYPILLFNKKKSFPCKRNGAQEAMKAWCHHSKALVLDVSLVCHVNKQTNKQTNVQ
jgi:hypothetical protein